MLLREVLGKTGRIGIGRVVIRTRQYLGALLPIENALVLDLMRFPQELAEPGEFALPKGNSKSYRVTAKEVQMAAQLVESMSVKWQPDDYKDEFRSKLRRIIDEEVAKQSGRRVRKAKAVEAETAPDATTNVVDFMALLKRSLDRKEGKSAARRERAPRRSSASARARNTRRRVS